MGESVKWKMENEKGHCKMENRFFQAGKWKMPVFKAGKWKQYPLLSPLMGESVRGLNTCGALTKSLIVEVHISCQCAEQKT